MRIGVGIYHIAFVEQQLFALGHLSFRRDKIKMFNYRMLKFRQNEHISGLCHQKKLNCILLSGECDKSALMQNVFDMKSETLSASTAV